MLIEANDIGGAGSPQAVVDPKGTVTAPWHQSDGVGYNIRANRFE